MMYCNAVSLDPLDDQCEEYYEATRKRPDGRSLAPLHDVIWQATCVALAKWSVSAAEFDAVLRRLTRSARTWKMGHTSRNYIAYLRKNF